MNYKVLFHVIFLFSYLLFMVSIAGDARLEFYDRQVLYALTNLNFIGLTILIELREKKGK